MLEALFWVWMGLCAGVPLGMALTAWMGANGRDDEPGR